MTASCSRCPSANEALAVGLALLFTLLSACGDERQVRLAVGPCDACSGQCVVEEHRDAGGEHTTDPVTYPDPPPTSGAHDPCWARWGSYSVEVPAARWLHNAEHGGVIFLHACGASCPSLSRLESFVEDHPGQALLTPYGALPTQFAAVAWRYRLMLGCYDPDALEDFYFDHVNQAPESERDEPPASCPQVQ